MLQNPTEWMIRVLAHSGAYFSARRRDLRFGTTENNQQVPLAPTMKESIVLVASALIATVTFAAAFTMPGSYKIGGDPMAGTPELGRRYGFKVFLVADILFLLLGGGHLQPRRVRGPGRRRPPGPPHLREARRVALPHRSQERHRRLRARGQRGDVGHFYHHHRHRRNSRSWFGGLRERSACPRSQVYVGDVLQVWLVTCVEPVSVDELTSGMDHAAAQKLFMDARLGHVQAFLDLWLDICGCLHCHTEAERRPLIGRARSALLFRY